LAVLLSKMSFLKAHDLFQTKDTSWDSNVAPGWLPGTLGISDDDFESNRANEPEPPAGDQQEAWDQIAFGVPWKSICQLMGYRYDKTKLASAQPLLTQLAYASSWLRYLIVQPIAVVETLWLPETIPELVHNDDLKLSKL